jgi:hypothetical protein
MLSNSSTKKATGYFYTTVSGFRTESYNGTFPTIYPLHFHQKLNWKHNIYSKTQKIHRRRFKPTVASDKLYLEIMLYMAFARL